MTTMTSAAQESVAEPLPPPSYLHPLHLLDQFLAAELAAADNDNHDREQAAQKDNDGERKATINCISLREEDKNVHQDRILRVTDYLYGGSILEAALALLDTVGAIRHVRAEPSNRSMYLVRGASYRGKTSAAGGVEYYVCLVDHGMLYCSCRSYFERAKTDTKAVCKHLLALKLLPHLECHCCQEEKVPDSEYAKFLIGRILPGE